MNIIKRQDIQNNIELTIDDVISYLEESRYYPSVREAGDAPTDSAVSKASDCIKKLVVELIEYGVTVDDLTKETTFEEIIAEINSVQDGNIADDIEGLKKIDSFVRDNGERKYRYQNTVYEHIPTKRFICVEEQQANGGDFDGIVGSINAQETKKKEIVTYEWA